MSEAQTKADSKSPQYAPFTVEFGDADGSSFVLKTLMRKVRGAWSVAKMHSHDGPKEMIPQMMGMPDIPGLRLNVDISRKSAELFDPLEDDPELLKQINSVREQASAISGAPFTFVPRVNVDMRRDDAMKTLLLELKQMEDNKQLTVVVGAMPTKRLIASLPGRAYFDMLNSGRKPKYVDEVPAWEERLDLQSI